MLQNHLKYSQSCSPLLHYRFAYRANSCGNAITKPPALLHTGKERDSETGFSYFGARYYDSDLMTGWLSVDPMADKYPSLSPYAYCGRNPIRLVDPDGEEIAFAGNEEEKAYYQYRNIIFFNKKYSHIRREIINLENAKEVFRIRLNGNVSNKKGGGNFVYNKETNEFDINIMDGGNFNTIEKLSHELKHADQYMNRKFGFDLRGDSKFGKFMAFDLYDEYEAYERQGWLGNTLTREEIQERYKEDKLANRQNRIYDGYMQFSYENIKKTNYHHINKKSKLCFLYFNWEKDI